MTHNNLFLRITNNEKLEFYSLNPDTNKIYLNDLKHYLENSFEEVFKIMNNEKKNLIYEFKKNFPLTYLKINVLEVVLSAVVRSINSREKGYRGEQEVLKVFEELFFYINFKNNFNKIDFELKLAYLISSNIFILKSSWKNNENTQRIECGTLIDDIWNDFEIYILNALIFCQKNNIITVKFKKYFKSFIWRVLLSIKDERFVINIKEQKEGKYKTIYFAQSLFVSQMENRNDLIHYYGNINFVSCNVVHHKEMILNGGLYYKNKCKLIKKNKFGIFTNLNEKIDFSDLIEQVKKIQNVSFFKDEEMIEKINIKNEQNRLISIEETLKNLKKFYRINNEKNVMEEMVKCENLILKKEGIEKKQSENKLKFLKKLREKGIEKFQPFAYNIKKYQKNMSRLFILDLFESFKNCNINSPIYFPIFFDFRGRFYRKSLIAPEVGWPFRFMYYFGEETKPASEKLFEKEKYFEIINFIQRKNRIEYKDDEICAILWTLIAIGKQFVNKKQICSESYFVETGFVVYKEIKEGGNSNLNELEIYYYILLINSIGKTNFKNRYIFKDVSASIFQNALLVLGYKNEETLKYLNVDGENWTDPYFLFVEEISKNIDKKYRKYLTRSTLKKPIMTRYYGASLLTSFCYFIKKIEDLFPEDFINKGLRDDIFKMFKQVYSELNELEKKLYYEYSMRDLKMMLNDWKITNLNSYAINVDLNNYKRSFSRLDIVVEKVRRTISLSVQKEEVIDEIKNKNSIIPNVFHFVDAAYARELIKESRFTVLSIHDAFAISPFNASDFIINANRIFKTMSFKDLPLKPKQIPMKSFNKFNIL